MKFTQLIIVKLQLNKNIIYDLIHILKYQNTINIYWYFTRNKLKNYCNSISTF